MYTADVDFVPAAAGWDVLYYGGDGTYEQTPIVAWAVLRDEGGFLRAVPVTADTAWSLDEDRTVCLPDGTVTCGDKMAWTSISAWLAAMIERGEPRTLQPDEPSPTPPIVLDKFRNRFQRPLDHET
jgi:hypothetical protein